jgi:hypothetical protein
MNNSTQRVVNIIIDSSIIGFSIASILISSIMLIFIIYHLIKRKKSPHQVALLLTGNMYFALSLFFIWIIITFQITLEGHIDPDFPSHDNQLCRIHSYFVTVIICAVFYSNTLQAIYRLCRVVVYTRKRFQSFQVYVIAIVLQWIICFMAILPALLFDHFEYVTNDFHCQIPYTSFRSIFLYGAIIYVVPLTITIGCYVFTLRKSRLRQTMTQIQRLTIQRDIIVLFRICILLGLMISFFIPVTIIFIIISSTGYSPWWSSQARWITYVISMSSVTIVLTFISPHVMNLWKNFIRTRKRIHRATVAPVNYQNQLDKY